MRPFLCFLLACVPAVDGVAQGLVARGYQSQIRFQEPSGPFAFSGFARGPAGLLYVGVYHNLVAVDPQGGRTQVFAVTPGGALGLIVRPRGGNDLFFSEAGTTRAWRLDVTAPANPVQGKMPSNAFDLASAPTGELLASANPLWPAPGASSGVWLVDFAGGVHREILSVAGPSGPLAFDGGGDLYYAEQSNVFPTPPGSVRVLRFRAADVQRALRGGPKLRVSEAAAILTGLDGAYDLAFDDRQRLHISDPQHGDVRRTLPGMFVLAPTPLVGRPPPPYQPGILQIVFADDGPATFDPYQPSTGAALYAHATDWALQADVLEIRPDRPRIQGAPGGTVSPGPWSLTLENLPPSGVGVLCISTLPPVPERSWFQLAGAPFWSGLDLSVPPVCLAFAIPASGRAVLSFRQRRGSSGALFLQALGIDSPTAPTAFGTSAVYTLNLLP